MISPDTSLGKFCINILDDWQFLTVNKSTKQITDRFGVLRTPEHLAEENASKSGTD